MDRLFQPKEQKQRLFKKFDRLDLFPYFIALLLLFAEGYILFQFIHICEKINY